MKDFLNELKKQGEIVEALASKIESGENYIDELKAYLSVLNQTIVKLFDFMQNPECQIELDRNFVLQVLNDIVYGIEKDDPVCLTDVLRYGLIEVFEYVIAELQGEESYERTGL